MTRAHASTHRHERAALGVRAIGFAAAACAAIAGAGCSPAAPDDAASTGSGGTTGSGGSYPLTHYEDGSWLLDAVPSSSGPVYPPAIAHTADGTAWIAWTAYDAVSPYRLWLAHGKAGGFTAEPLEPGGRVSMRAFGEQVFLAYEGTSNGLYDIFFLRFDGTTWHGPVDLTAPFDAPGEWHYDWAPDLVVSPNGKVAVVYGSQNNNGVSEVRVLHVENDTPVGEPITVLGGNCYDERALFDADDVLHVLTNCNGTSLYATDESGEFVAVGSPPVASVNGLPSVALGQNGRTLHLAWRGSDVCDYIGYARGRNESWSTPYAAQACDGVGNARLAVDPWNRPLVVFSGDNLAGFGAQGVYLTYYQQGEALAEPMLVADSPDGMLDVGGVSLDPVTELPVAALWHLDNTLGYYVIVAASYREGVAP